MAKVSRECSQSVSFGVFNDRYVSRADVESFLEPRVELGSDVIRAIAVPFFVPASSAIEVSGIYEKMDRPDMPSGQYVLLFQIGYPRMSERESRPDEQPRRLWCKLTVVASDLIKLEILRRNAELDPPDPLVMDGVPA
jgi:hypothetical protein